MYWRENYYLNYYAEVPGMELDFVGPFWMKMTVTPFDRIFAKEREKGK
jgi:hypothetical protein